MQRETVVPPGSVTDRRDDSVLRVRVTAPPVEGRAIRALTELFADVIGISRGDVCVVVGQLSHDKVIAVDGLSTPDVWARLRRSLGGAAGDVTR